MPAAGCRRSAVKRRNRTPIGSAVSSLRAGWHSPQGNRRAGTWIAVEPVASCSRRRDARRNVFWKLWRGKEGKCPPIIKRITVTKATTATTRRIRATRAAAARPTLAVRAVRIIRERAVRPAPSTAFIAAATSGGAGNSAAPSSIGRGSPPPGPERAAGVVPDRSYGRKRFASALGPPVGVRRVGDFASGTVLGLLVRAVGSRGRRCPFGWGG